LKFKFGIEEMSVLQHWDFYLLALWGHIQWQYS